MVPGIEFVGLNSPRSSQVRYFRRNEAAERDVPAIVSLLREAGIEAEPQYISGFEDKLKATRHYEIWLGDDVEG